MSTMVPTASAMYEFMAANRITTIS
jgi:hypothetical protein